jgi:hypothetical protein
LVEIALSDAGWPWRPTLSRWVDVLLLFEEGGE